MTPLNPVACAWFLLVAFTVAGIAQTAWFATPLSWKVAWPIDGGRHWRGRRLLGANKTTRGFVVMIPATAAVFAAGAMLLVDPAASGLWPATPGQYASLGAWAAFGFMAGELPNSFMKRQLDIGPGTAPRSSLGAACQFIVDRLDSGIGMLLALSLAVEVPWLTWLTVLAVGPAIHWSFSVAMFSLGLKQRPA